MVLKASIKKLRQIAFFLFLMPTLALIGSLILNNYLVNYNFFFDHDYSNYVKDEPNNILKIECNENNEYCFNHAVYFDTNNQTSRIKKLDLCYKNKVNFYVVSENVKYKISDVFVENLNTEERILNKFRNKNFFFEIKTIEKKNESCIKNFKFSRTLYSLFPYYYNYVSEVKSTAKLATGESVNPFLYGEVSISNLVKRFPINYVFKPLLYISVVLMLFYWISYNKIFNELIRKKINIFTVFGLLSAIFLFFHVLFLGSEIDNELFKKIRKLIIVCFILFELLAQIFLAKDIYKNKETLSNYCKIFIVYSKIVFVSIVSLITLAIIFLLSIYNLESKIDYILEWNYFLFLLIFYFLSFLMWKKTS